MERKDFFYEDDNRQVVTFEMNEKTLMVNATEMAKIFGKKVENFTRIDTTEAFIQACLKNADQRFLEIKNREDLIVSRQKSGTWMHRILALKFAAWLNPDFEVWVYRLIDELLFGEYHELKKSVKKSASRRSKIERLKQKLRQDNADFKELETLESEEQKEARYRSRQIVTQIKLFQDETEEE